VNRVPRPASPREAGVALLTALLIVLALSTLAVGALEGLQRTRRLDANASSLSQARWYAIGAEAQVRSVAAEFRQGALGRVAFARGPRVFTFPLETGVMEIAVRDGSLCLNLNGVVAGAGDLMQRNEIGAAQLENLMIELGAPKAAAGRTIEALVDWIDTDDGRMAPGADDARYLARAPGYLTGAQPLAEVSELRAIDGFGPDLYAVLRPFVCVLPDVGPTRINLNALTPEQAPVLVALTLGAMPRKAAADLIAGRPAFGWSDIQQVRDAARLAGYDFPESALTQLDLDPRYLDLAINVVHLDAEVVLTEQLVFSGDRFRTVARRWGGEP
jgi:general secretion pathway protein K